MKKLATLLIILALATGGVFAYDSTLNLSTIVDQTQGMKITASQFTGTTLEALNSAAEVT